MVRTPCLGQRVQVWYAGPRRHWPHHGKVGTVVVRSVGPGPRNHGVRMDSDGTDGTGELVIVPAGNLRSKTYE